jgi:hypothetical protein
LSFKAVAASIAEAATPQPQKGSLPPLFGRIKNATRPALITIDKAVDHQRNDAHPNNGIPGSRNNPVYDQQNQQRHGKLQNPFF